MIHGVRKRVNSYEDIGILVHSFIFEELVRFMGSRMVPGSNQEAVDHHATATDTSKQ